MKITEFWPFDRDAQDTYIAQLTEKVTPYIVGKNVVSIRVSGARHILSRIDALETENERLRGHLKIAVEQLKGCAVNHYGNDFEIHGMPGFITDMEAALADLVRVEP